MKHALIIALAAALGSALGPGLAAAQTPTSPAGLAPTAQPKMVRAAGMPLPDDALAPGILTVRVINGGFTNNVANQPVSVSVDGGAQEQATTGQDGRAQFAHLPIGAKVTARTTLGDTTLVSDEFVIPAESGIRILLALGEAAVATGPVAAPSAGAGGLDSALSSTLPATAPVATGPTPRPVGQSDGVVAVKLTLVAAITFMVCWLFFGRRARRPARAAVGGPVEAGERTLGRAEGVLAD
jgi:hypothetical protein